MGNKSAGVTCTRYKRFNEILKRGTLPVNINIGLLCTNDKMYAATQEPVRKIP